MERDLYYNMRVTLIFLLTMVSALGMAQKSVTYTFTGKNNGLIAKEKEIGLYVSAGTAPKGVSVGTITNVTYDESEEEDINNVSVGNTVGVALIPQYLVSPEQEAVINFKNFAYEIASVEWTSRSQVPMLTSETTTWVTAWGTENTGTDISTWTKTADTTPLSNTFSGQVSYSTDNFTNDKNFAGIKSLHIRCDSKQDLHGQSMKDFIIYYYEPVITINCDNELALSTASSGTKSTTVSASITDHNGAFQDAMLSLSYSDVDASVATISGNTITAGTTAGSVLITATLTFDGTVIATATKKVQIGKFDFDFVQGDLYCGYQSNENSDPSNVQAYAYNKDKNLGLRLSSEGNYDSNYWWTSATGYLNCLNSESGQITNIYTQQNKYFRACMQRIDYNQYVPAYSEVSVNINFVMESTRYSTSYAGIASAGFGIAMYNFGQGKDQIWPTKESSANSESYKYFTTKNSEWTSSNTTREPLIVKGGGWGTNGGRNGVTKSLTVNTDFIFDNKKGYDDTKMTQQLGAYSFLLCGTYYDSKVNSTFKYSGRSKTITYYRYINYNGHGNSDGSTETTTGTCKSTVDNYKTATAKVASNGFTKAEDDNYTYEFVSWNTEEDGSGTTYLPGDGINIYDDKGDCGAGPITLYAQWKAKAKATDRTETTESDNVYSLWGNGGTITDENDVEQEVVAARFVLGATASNVTPATYTGYTFNGYYDATVDGTQIFDASGVPVGDGTIITSDGKWAAEHDVYLYAQWTKNESVKPKTITVILNANDGTLSGAGTFTCTEGSSENNNIASLTPTRDGYKFSGWYTTTDNTGLMVYNANGESVYLASYSTDDEGNITPVYVALNPTFFNTNGKYVGSASPFNANFTIYAHWIQDNSVLTFHEGESTAANSAYYKIGTGSEQKFSTAPTYEAGVYDKVIITRKLNKDQWNTVCFPFDIYKKQVAALFSDVEMYSDLEVNGDNANMKFKKCDIIMAGVPYFVKLNSDLPTDENGDVYVSSQSDTNVTELIFTSVEAGKTPTTISLTKDNTTVSMIGEFNTDVSIPTGALFLLGNKIYKQGGVYDGYQYSVKNKGFRCYITNTTGNNSAKVYNLLDTYIELDDVRDDIATNVEEIQIDPDHSTFSIAPTEIYDLYGRKLKGISDKGIYIMNGKKYIAQ